MSVVEQPVMRSVWPDYRSVWRWHFYAGLFCIPFVIVLALSGSIYLFKPQIEAWNDRAFDNLQIDGPPASFAGQVQAALAAVPDSTPSGYELPPTDHSAARVIVRSNGEAIRVYVHPQT
ncbi:MAG TPA: PepSY domain-containing protein, partial [Planctomycetaceae bacterium]|nr:PepSY domain-containing protein [Planctomycetaceae bacterium]